MYILSATVPAGHQWSVSNACQVCRSADVQGCWSAGCWLLVWTVSFRGPQGAVSKLLASPDFHVFSHQFSNPLKTTFGAHLAPTWCQNDLKK